MAKYSEFFKERITNLPPPNDKGECVVPCVFHTDHNPSLAVNVETGKWKCYTPSCPGHAGGGFKKFDQLLTGELTTAGEVKAPPIDEAVIDGFHAVLLLSPTPLEILTKRRGLTLETIKKHKLGWDGTRILIPVRSPDGAIVNIRKYAYGAKEDKMIGWGPRYNRARLFPAANLVANDLLLCEGELDALIAEQNGFSAITSTGGADSWLSEFNAAIKGKNVTIAYDVDEPGRRGAKTLAQKIVRIAAIVRIATLPLAGSKEEKDITDYLVAHKHSAAELAKVLESAEVIAAIAEDKPPSAEVHDIHLSHIGEDTYVGKRVRSTVLIAGKDLAPFQVPKCVAFTCASVDTEKRCDRCAIAKGNGKAELKIPNWSHEILQMVNTPIDKLNSQLERLIGIPERCPKFKFEVTEFSNVESIKAIPEIDFQAEQSEYVIRSLFYLGHGIDTNRTYTIEGIVMPEPKTQYATALIYDAKPAQNSIEKFDQSPETHKALSIFQVRNAV